MTTPINAWCAHLGIDVPRVEAVMAHPDANYYTLLMVALLERGAPMTLPDVAVRLAVAGFGAPLDILSSLGRCRPARAPIYREGGQYSVDPYDADLDLWVFRLGLRPPKFSPVPLVTPPLPAVPGPEVALTVAELDRAWQDAHLTSWSMQRIVLAVLDANAGPMSPREVVAFVDARCRRHPVRDHGRAFVRRGSSVLVQADGRWAIAAGADLAGMRAAVRARYVAAQRWARSDPSALEARREEVERERTAHAHALAKLRRAVIYAVGGARPTAVAMVDIDAHTVTTFTGHELGVVPGRLEAFDVIAAIDVRALLRALGFDPGARQLAELGPPQKTITVNTRGRTIQITTEMLITSSCGIPRPLGPPPKRSTPVQHLETAAKSLFALYQYGRLHGAVHLRSGKFEAQLSVPWVHRDEVTFGHLIRAAAEARVPLDVVLGAAPEWEHPWSRGELVFVESDPEHTWRYWLVDADGAPVDRCEVQLARLFVVHDA